MSTGSSRRIIPLLILVLGFAASQNLWRLELLLNPVEADIAPGTVAMYGTAWCGYCADTRDFFERADIPFANHDIERSPSAAEAFERLGGQGVPLVKIGNRIIHGFDPGAMREALQQLPPPRVQ